MIYMQFSAMTERRVGTKTVIDEADCEGAV